MYRTRISLMIAALLTAGAAQSSIPARAEIQSQPAAAATIKRPINRPSTAGVVPRDAAATACDSLLCRPYLIIGLGF